MSVIEAAALLGISYAEGHSGSAKNSQNVDYSQGCAKTSEQNTKSKPWK